MGRILEALALLAIPLGVILVSTLPKRNPAAMVKRFKQVMADFPALKYGAKVYRVSYAHIGSAIWSDVEKELQQLKSMGHTHYALHLNYNPWLKNKTAQIAIIDQTVAWIRNNGGVLHIVDAGAEDWRTNQITWAQMKDYWRARIRLWASTYAPDSITVIKEPGYYIPFISDPQNMSIQEFINLSQELTAIVKTASSLSTTVFADNMGGYVPGLPGYDALNYTLLAGVLADPNLDAFGMDFYGDSSCQDNKTAFLGDLVNAVRGSGKQLWITEAWPTTAGNLNHCSIYKQGLWAEHISGYAIGRNIPIIEWFFTQEFL